MQIVIINNKRILIKDNDEQLDISDEKIIQYTGIFYKPKEENRISIYDVDIVETKFIGKVETYRAASDEITGIYIVPLYLLDKEWIKIGNYVSPKNKYFLYPHLLMLPGKYYHYYPLYFLHTCEPAYLNEFTNITKTIDLHYIA
jgi:hypothetical protein